MTDTSVSPVMSNTVEVFEDEDSSDMLATLGNGNITMEAASRKKLQIVAKYPFQDIQQCFHQVLREVTNPTVTDLVNSLEENQVDLEEYVMELLCTKKRHQHIFQFYSEEISRKDAELKRKDEELKRKDEEIRRKDEELDRLGRLPGQGYKW
ncbi:uncharacterized protein LOC143054334 isoform X2 [Mytilus galloprovincialis]|uniref:uncharacterized protein LOC143054334 isoform X2 n=1 Tax=Mytilus galloprovincialis TaxID=29158 RepID=UPI003F7C9794